MKKILSIFILMIFLWNIQTNAEETKLPAIKINNPCDIQFSIEARNDYNHPQYKLGYDRCFSAYNSYINSLEQAIKDWEIASISWKKDDWDKAEEWLNSIYGIIITYGENLVGWFDRDILLTDISKYIKAVKIRTLLNVPKIVQTATTIKSWSIINTSTSWSVLSTESICKPWFTVIFKTGKCRKIFKKKVITWF